MCEHEFCNHTPVGIWTIHKQLLWKSKLKLPTLFVYIQNIIRNHINLYIGCLLKKHNSCELLVTDKFEFVMEYIVFEYCERIGRIIEWINQLESRIPERSYVLMLLDSENQLMQMENRKLRNDDMKRKTIYGRSLISKT